MRSAAIGTIIVGILLFIIHFVAVELHLYWKFWWLDIVTHFLGGIWLVFAWRTLCDIRLMQTHWWSLPIIIPILVTVMIIWEIFGIYVEQGFKDGFIPDTTLDLICGVIGVVIGFYLLQRLKIITTKNIY